MIKNFYQDKQPKTGTATQTKTNLYKADKLEVQVKARMKTGNKSKTC